MRSSKATFFAAGAITALVLGSGTAVAATGGKFILGRSNSASTTTTLTNGAGSALTLKSKAGTPALRVGNSIKVPYLNADTVDGVDSSAFARTAGKTGSFDYVGESIDADGNGSIDTIVAFADCPPGTQLTGGGMGNYTRSGVTLESAPFTDPESYIVVVGVDESVTEDPADVYASATCYSPTGPIAGAYGLARTAPSDPVSRLSAKTLERLAASAVERNQERKSNGGGTRPH